MIIKITQNSRCSCFSFHVCCRMVVRATGVFYHPLLPAGICLHRQFQMLRAAKLKIKTVDFMEWITESKEHTVAVKPHAFLFSCRGSRKEGLTQYGSSYIHVWLGLLIKPKAAFCKARRHTSGEDKETIHQLSDSEGEGSRQYDQYDLVIGGSHAEFMHHSPLQNDGSERKDSTRTSCYCKSFTWYRRWETSKLHQHWIKQTECKKGLGME